MADRLPRETFTGKVIVTNEHGVKLDSDPDTWLNKSNRGEAANILLPAKGSNVSVTCVQSGDRYYIEKIEAATGQSQGQAAPAASSSGHSDGGMVRSSDVQLYIVRQSQYRIAMELLVHNARILREDALAHDPEHAAGVGIVKVEHIIMAGDRLVAAVMRAPDQGG